MKKILFYLLMFIGLPALLYAATTSSNGYFYLPAVGDTGTTVHDTWVATQEATDAVIGTNVTHTTSTGADHSYVNQSVTTTGTPQFSSLGVGTAASDALLTVASGVSLGGALQSDPCGTFPPGTLFYNEVSNVLCFCDGTNDLQVGVGSTTPCF